MRVFPERVNWEWRTYLESGWHYPTGWCLRMNKKEKVSSVLMREAFLWLSQVYYTGTEYKVHSQYRTRTLSFPRTTGEVRGRSLSCCHQWALHSLREHPSSCSALTFYSGYLGHKPPQRRPCPLGQAAPTQLAVGYNSHNGAPMHALVARLSQLWGILELCMQINPFFFMLLLSGIWYQPQK